MLDAYCERTGPGLFAEPLNALTNASFLIAAWAVWLMVRHQGRPPLEVEVLLALSVSVGVGSGLWHTLATAWALVLDIVPILLFLVWYFWVYLRKVAGASTPLAVALVLMFLVVSYLAQGWPEILNGALAYVPALVFLLGLGIVHAGHDRGGRFSLLWASGAYLTALVFRTIDKDVCPGLPIGTHFLWHSFAGVAAYLAMRGYILSLDLHAAPRRSSTLGTA